MPPDSTSARSPRGHQPDRATWYWPAPRSLSDGAYRLVDHFHLADWTDALKLIRDHGTIALPPSAAADAGRAGWRPVPT
ncbi:hypothetical protein [Kitasatospora sp. McL0602]|uniref:hypothetical protein n=1 Tax=Kitasatospora sp. McL0602 TaxID=3439530 RepID=UPI003F8CD093